jgi:hypothetical protein
MTYRLVMSSDYKDFAEKVNSALVGGWTLQGGIAVQKNEDGDTVYYQAIVKEV